MKFAFLILLLIGVLFESVGDILFKYWSINSKNVFLIIGVLFYTVSTVVWAYSLRLEYLSKAITIFTVLNLIIIILVGIIFFKEDVSTVNKVGMLLGVISVVLMQL